ncbi:4-oxalocrotonate tautomerase [Pedosphaera parvula Ellin514]|uniref:4-oxalocrotonate tautomerase n=1 Tax=Pedosphaera parvula (strain Ellin514) TaxID=320771 RepID=B9XC70_PEDPL|nr:4-oxalocrotonate tautomerase [Pedosphaera parvula Ellin514]
MPLINVKVLEGVFTPAQKQQMVRKLTDAMVSIEGENMRAATVVIIEEVKSGDWGFGGNPLTTKDAKAMAAGKFKGSRTTTSRGQQRLPRSARLRR